MFVLVCSIEKHHVTPCLFFFVVVDADAYGEVDKTKKKPKSKSTGKPSGSSFRCLLLSQRNFYDMSNCPH